MGITMSLLRMPEAEFAKLNNAAGVANISFIGGDFEALNVNFQPLDLSIKSSGFLDLDKEWDIQDYMLNGRAATEESKAPPPLGWAIQGDTATEWEATYGYVSYLKPDQVKSVAAALAAITEEQITERYDPVKMSQADIYTYHDSDEALEEIIVVFNELQAFYTEAAAASDMVLMASY